MKRKALSLILALLLCLFSAGCGGEEAPAESAIPLPSAIDTDNRSEDESWAVYWYLCGSDLETNYGCATADLQEMLEVQLPENVNVVIETGGAAVWQNDLMDSSKIQRWLYNSEGLQLLEEEASANMGDAQTLCDFLRFADENYPADKVAVTFWNHGGGSVGGAAFDELYGYDSLNLAELYQAFDAVWGADSAAPALELVGFDTCLMATVDVAAVFRDFAKYLVASEEVEPGNGWLYSGWLAALAAEPDMSGEKLGIAICDSYYSGCEAVGTQEQVTLSVTDLTKLSPLLTAYEEFGEEAFAAASRDSGFFAELGRAAVQSENYGGNTREQGYTNMMDLGHFARKTANLLPSAKKVCDALAECVIYRVGGCYRAEASGLSCYYSYNGDIDDFNGYVDMGTGNAFKQLYAYELTGETTDGGEQYLQSLSISLLPKIVTLNDKNWDNIPLELDENGNAVLRLDKECGKILTKIGFSLYYLDEENDLMLLLGTDNDITADWENGVFYDNFRGVWGAVDGHLVYMELSFEGEQYNLYSVPILLNDELYNLQVVYDFSTEKWGILGAVPAPDEYGMASKEVRLLREGDSITTIWKLASLGDDDDFEMYTAEQFCVTADTAFGEIELIDGSYAMVFEMCDTVGNYAYSDAVAFSCENGEIWTTVNQS